MFHFEFGARFKLMMMMEDSAHPYALADTKTQHWQHRIDILLSYQKLSVKQIRDLFKHHPMANYLVV